MMKRKIKLADKNKDNWIYNCDKCKYVLFSVFECTNKCRIYCKEHLPQNNSCHICRGEFIYNKQLDEEIKNNFKIKCLKCLEEIVLKIFRISLAN